MDRLLPTEPDVESCIWHTAQHETNLIDRAGAAEFGLSLFCQYGRLHAIFRPDEVKNGKAGEAGEAFMKLNEARLFAMFAGWMMAFYGIRRRSWKGTMVAVTGLGLTGAAMTI